MYTEIDLQNLKEIEQFLIDNNLDYKINNNFSDNIPSPKAEIETSFLMNAKNNRTYEICYIPSHEYPTNYPQHNIEGVQKDYFYKLSKAAEDNNSFRCWVKDYEWKDDRKREVLKSYFLHALGLTKNKVYARDCEVHVIETKEAREFELKHCFYGKRGASLNLGLRLKKDKCGLPAGTLIMVYTFGLNFFGKDKSIEVLRVGTIKFHQVIGGASKLLKHFVNNYKVMKVGKNIVPVTKLKFYSDYDHNIGMSMDSLDFKFVSYSGGGFMNYWLETNEVKGRQPSRHKWVVQQMKDGKAIAIPNAGVKTFVMDINKDVDFTDIDTVQKEQTKKLFEYKSRLRITPSALSGKTELEENW